MNIESNNFAINIQKELDFALTNKDIFNLIDYHLLNDNSPAEFLYEMSVKTENYKYPLTMLFDLRDIDQSPTFHPEGNVWNHTMLVINEAAKRRILSIEPKVFMWSALLHDIGKSVTTKILKGRITSYQHDIIGADLSKKFLLEFTDDPTFINKVSELVRYHMQLLFVIKKMPYADIKGMKRNTDIYEVALLGLCDRLGRTGSAEVIEDKNMQKFIELCS